MMAIFNLTHASKTKVGSDTVRGVSGGERKRVSIAEMALSLTPVACWDDCTRGLDAATALDVVRALRLAAEMLGACEIASLYQASDAIYEEFEKVTVLFEGRQVYFGPSNEAKGYFERMGWVCPPRQTTPDFLTAVTSPEERTAAPGKENYVPRTAGEFEAYWKASEEYAALRRDINAHEAEHPLEEKGSAYQDFKETMQQKQVKHSTSGSAHLTSLLTQMKWCLIRAWQRTVNDKASTLTAVIGQVVLALVFGSMFYQTPNTTAGFFSKGAVLFFAVLLNALISITEVNKVYALRPVIAKQSAWAFYRPFVEALAGFILDLPIKLAAALCFNTILYFLVGLRVEPGAFFLFFLFNYLAAITMACIFRSIAAATHSAPQALAAASVLMLVIVIYSGFTLPHAWMHPWFGWIKWINPVAFAFEALMVNEFHGREFACSEIVPAYPSPPAGAFVCGIPGAVAGQHTVTGDAYLETKFEYYYTHIWRNLGILLLFTCCFLALYLVATEWNSRSQRMQVGPNKLELEKDSCELERGSDSPPSAASLDPTADAQHVALERGRTFAWRNINYDIPVQGGQTRRLLNDVSGWVQSGTLTALMGVSGAGKTTLLDVLAQRKSVGVVTGDMFVDGRPLDVSFARQAGYALQQDVHLETATVRESLRFSALLRQPKHVSRDEKHAYVERVMAMLGIGGLADEHVGGLSMARRKLVTIGVELAAKPEVLLFLDEPTSGLDSQSSFAIVALLRRLADAGQTVLSTVHQPSAVLFAQFDRLLFLDKGGKTVYFGNTGPQCCTLLNYFEAHGARRCGSTENPAEYIFDVVAGRDGNSKVDWPALWQQSAESKAISDVLGHLALQHETSDGQDQHRTKHSEYAAPFLSQLHHVWLRTWIHYWRSPGYVWSRAALAAGSSLFNAYSFFDPASSPQGVQNSMFSVFMLTTVFTAMVQQIIPRFAAQRELYEVREQPSKVYSWTVFFIIHVAIEIPFQIFSGIVAFACFNYNVFGILSAERQGLVLLFCIQFFVFTSTFAHMFISALSDPDTAGILGVFVFILTLVFNGVMQPKDALPGFWVFMYRVSPQTYWVSGIVSTGLHDQSLQCSSSELYHLDPPMNSGMTCEQYLKEYLSVAPGHLNNPNATSDCQYCPVSLSDQYLASSDIFWTDRWRNFGLGWAYIIFNVCAAAVVFRVRQLSIRKRSSS